MKKYIFFLSLLFLFSTCKTNDTVSDQKHLFYLHGRIIELQGINAVSEKYGAYQYNEIIQALKNTGAIVHNDIRNSSTDFYDFSNKISKQIDSLISENVKPENITIIGASKGAVMAMNISNQNTHTINYVLLAANNDYIEAENDWQLHGNILGIFEKSDEVAGKNYQYWISRSKEANLFEELELNTGLGHGFLYQPLEEWLIPTLQWSRIGSLNLKE